MASGAERGWRAVILYGTQERDTDTSRQLLSVPLNSLALRVPPGNLRNEACETPGCLKQTKEGNKKKTYFLFFPVLTLSAASHSAVDHDFSLKVTVSFGGLGAGLPLRTPHPTHKALEAGAPAQGPKGRWPQVAYLEKDSSHVGNSSAGGNSRLWFSSPWGSEVT